MWVDVPHPVQETFNPQYPPVPAPVSLAEGRYANVLQADVPKGFWLQPGSVSRVTAGDIQPCTCVCPWHTVWSPRGHPSSVSLLCPTQGNICYFMQEKK